MSKYLFALVLTTLTISVASVGAQAAEDHKAAAKKPATKSKAHAAKDEEAAPSGMTATDFHCAQGKKITIYRNPADVQDVKMRWNKKLYKMTRIETESGAERLENTADGFTWISVPAKAMLLDAKKGQTIVNDCKK